MSNDDLNEIITDSSRDNQTMQAILNGDATGTQHGSMCVIYCLFCCFCGAMLGNIVNFGVKLPVIVISAIDGIAGCSYATASIEIGTNITELVYEGLCTSVAGSDDVYIDNSAAEPLSQMIVAASSNDNSHTTATLGSSGYTETVL